MRIHYVHRDRFSDEMVEESKGKKSVRYPLREYETLGIISLTDARGKRTRIALLEEELTRQYAEEVEDLFVMSSHLLHTEARALLRKRANV